MRIWLVNTGEEPSFDKDRARRMRMGQLCAHLRQADHEVVYWTSCFSHARKCLVAKTTKVEQTGNLTIVWLRARGYRSHISLARLWDHVTVAREFRRVAPTLAVPDLIICSFPTIELAHAVTSFGVRTRVPVIVDVRDMWPDLIEWSVPRYLQPVARVALAPYESMAFSALRRATALTSITESFLRWSTDKAQRPRQPLDRVLHFCYEEETFTDEELEAAEHFWASLGVVKDGRPIVLFIGMLGRSLDLRPVIESAGILSQRGAGSPLFVLCGDGDMAGTYRESAQGIENVIMPGRINAVQIRSVMGMASIAISPLPDRRDFRLTINNKFTEYLSGGLPILVSPPDSETARLVTASDCGSGFVLSDPAALADLLTTLLNDPRKLAGWRQRARQLFEVRFRADDILTQWMTLINDVAQSRSAHDLAS